MYNAHNMWLVALVEMGIVGLVIFLLYFLYIFILSYKLKEKYIPACLLCFLVMGLTTTIAGQLVISILFTLIGIIGNNNDEPIYERDKVINNQ